MKHRRTMRGQSGFTLIEMIVALTVMAILAGAAVPISTRLITNKARTATEQEQSGIATSVGQFYSDTGQLPASIGELLIAPAGVAGWTGPYTDSISTDRVSGLMTLQVDAWSRPYSVTIAGDVWTVQSAGPDGNQGSGDDLVRSIDVTYLRREKTVARLEIVNQAILSYNGAWLDTDPLPALWPTAFNKLVARGFLPNDARLATDGWGSAFQESPAGAFPVVRISSVNMVAGP